MEFKADIQRAFNGLPGTGKTTTLMEVLEEEVQEGTNVSDIAASTFRRDMANEFESRARETVEELPDDNWMGTTHSLCYKLIGSDREVVEDRDRAAFCEELGVSCSYSNDPDAKSSLLSTGGGNIGDLAFQARDYCLHTGRDPRTDWRKTPLSVNERTDVETSATNFEDFNNAWEEYKDEHGLLDFNDMLLEVLDNELVPPVNVLISDEFQDKSLLQVRIFEMWSQEIDRVYVSGDRFQCIPEGETVATPDGEVQIESLDVGDEVTTAIGRGETTGTEITETHERPHDGDVVNLTTESGFTVRCTPDHELFARIPGQDGATDRYMVYVMKSDRGDYRVGTTQMPKHRFNSEPGTSALMIIGSHPTELDAREQEKIVAYKYGIPQDPFVHRGEGNGVPQECLDAVYDAVDTESGFKDLCEDVGLDPEGWHIVTQGTQSDGMGLGRGGARVPVRLTMRYRHDRDHAVHHVRVNTSSPEARSVLEEIDLLNAGDSSADGGRRYRKQSSNYAKMRILAEQVVSRLRSAGVSSHICEKSSFANNDGGGRYSSPMTVTPASQVSEGMKVPVIDDGEVRYETVADRTVEQVDTTVYDLTVPPMHNYVTGGCVVHNCIYGWAGTDPKYMDAALSAAEKSKTLDTSYRFGPDVWETATQILENTRTYDVPDIDPIGDSTVRSISYPKYKQGVDHHADDECLHLFRCNYMTDAAADVLEAQGVPFSSPYGVTWTPRLRNLYNGIAKFSATVRAYVNAEWASGMSFDHITTDEAIQLFETLRATVLKKSKTGTIETLRSMNDPDDPLTRKDMSLLSLVDVSAFKSDLHSGNPFRSNMFINSGFGSSSVRDRMANTWRRLDGEPIESINHRVKTVHASKGSEADVVFLFDGISRKIMDEHGPFPFRSESEARVFFVGATRAVEKLYLVDYPEAPKIRLPEP